MIVKRINSVLFLPTVSSNPLWLPAAGECLILAARAQNSPPLIQLYTASYRLSRDFFTARKSRRGRKKEGHCPQITQMDADKAKKRF
jgi:hypothetical protein